MKLMTKEVLEMFKRQGDCSNKSAKDIKIVCKFFLPDTQASWFCYEYNPEYKEFYAFVTLGMGPECDEAGPVSLTELEGLKGQWGCTVERDIHYPSGKYTLEQYFNGERP